ncbi:glycosyltransferase family 4 protein [Megalodesulfovibrio gigas]|uniref:Putative glycosyltransferase n=1 Tax=Megalodesulfovibrio gigas (strain ATCC 19364 / DSM 1382 / NCIMB 9332 / VKM B-1759) TaxID=1121448 RepID=T2G7Y1_MEGG1|nr:glycosyltransferase family 4 protein [Megalodesulfovibrio gigas]AGW12685.1 putative glycosyltransferase [Megalodesulfovibrio gigas DSM 1382 = ATCC 19364]
MKLCFLIHSLAAGGAERWVATMANHWAAQAGGAITAVTVLTMTPPARDFYALHPAIRRVCLGQEAVSAGVFHAVVKNLARVRSLRQALAREAPDVVLAVMPESSCLLALAGGRGRSWTAIGAEHSYPPRNRLGRGLPGRLRSLARAVLYGRLDAVVCLTTTTADWMLRHTRTRRAPVIPNPAVWPLPVQPPLLEPARAGAAGRMLLAVGRLVPEKGFDRLLEAVAVLASRHLAWELVILGEGPQRAALEAQCERLGMTARIRLPGLAGNVGEWYAAADAFVLTSHYEGFPSTLLEALAAGVPAVSVDCLTGPRDILRHEVDGLLVPQDDAPALIAALDRMMTDDALRRACAARAVEARDRFALPRLAARWEALFMELRRAYGA